MTRGVGSIPPPLLRSNGLLLLRFAEGVTPSPWIFQVVLLLGEGVSEGQQLTLQGEVNSSLFCNLERSLKREKFDGLLYFVREHPW